MEQRGAVPASRIQGTGWGGLDSGIGKDIIARTDQMASERAPWEKEWRDLADYCLPSASLGMRRTGLGGASYDRLMEGPSTRQASQRRFDSTAMTAVDRLASGMESLVTPQSEKWHDLQQEDAFADAETDEQKAWNERVRDRLFALRYEPRAGFTTANQKAIRSTIAFGTGVTYVEESFGTRGADPRTLPILYRHIPLSEALIAVNAQGEPDTLHRRFTMSARQAAQKFGDKISPKLQEAANDVKRCDTHFGFVHAVSPRDETGGRDGTMKTSPFASYYVEVDGAHLIGEGGFAEFPYVIYYWLQADESAYGESPAMLALDDIRGLNVTRKTALRSMQQWTDPPLMVSHDGVMNRPNLNPRAVNFGAVDGNGRPKIMPLITAQNPAAVQEIIESERNTVRETLYNNLFQILIQNPQMTATEAMLRANEKGELLGPAGAKIQSALSRMIDREIGILERKGAFEPDGSLEAPESVQGKSISPRFTSPLDRLRQMKEATGILTAYQAAAQISAAKGDPSIFDNFDDDESLRIIAEVNGAPARMMRTHDAVEQIREARQQAAEQAANMAMAKEAAAAAKDAGGALAGAGAGAVDGMQAAGMMGGMDPNTAPLPLPQLAAGPEDMAA